MKNGWTPFHKALYSQKIDTIQYLLQKNIDFNIKINNIETYKEFSLNLQNDLIKKLFE